MQSHKRLPERIVQAVIQHRAILVAACCVMAGCGTPAVESAPFRVQDDGIVGPLTATPGDAARGREIVLGRDGNCLLCHAIPEGRERSRANFGPPLSGVGARLTAAQLRLRIVDPARVNRNAAMPAFYRTDGLDQVALPFRGRTILTAQQVEDVVAYLLTLN